MISRAPIMLVLALVASAARAQQSTAGVTIEASHGGAGNGLTNTTITVPLNTTYTNTALSEVSYLFLTSATGVDIESIICTPHLYANGTGPAGLPFTSSQPSLLSTNTVQVGSITCVSSSASGSNNTTTSSTTLLRTPTPTLPSTNLTVYATTVGSTSSSGPRLISSASALSVPNPATSTFVTTLSASSASTPERSTVTSVLLASGSASAASDSTTISAGGVEAASSTSSASASLTSGNAAAKLSFAELMWPGLAIGALGFAMAV